MEFGAVFLIALAVLIAEGNAGSSAQYRGVGQRSIRQAVVTGSFGQAPAANKFSFNVPQQPQFQQQQSQQFQQQQPQQFQQQPQPIQQSPLFQHPKHQPFHQQQFQTPVQKAIPDRQTNFNAGLPQKVVNSATNSVVREAVGHPPIYSQLIAARDSYGRSLVDKLPSNATKIRPNIVDGFSCAGRIYGYYADVANDCQIFHVCFPLKDVFKNDKDVARVPDITYHFSFICNEFTIFSQDSMTCAWKYEAVPCQYAEQLYVRNEEFFKTTTARPAYTPVTQGQYQG